MSGENILLDLPLRGEMMEPYQGNSGILYKLENLNLIFLGQNISISRRDSINDDLSNKKVFFSDDSKGIINNKYTGLSSSIIISFFNNYN